MKGFLIMAINAGLLSSALAVSEYRLGGVDGNPWTSPLSLDGAGEFVRLDADGVVVARTSVATTPFGAGVDTLIDFSEGSIAPRYIEPGVNLALVDPDSETQQTPLVYTGGTVEVTDAYCPTLNAFRFILRKMLDGDPTTAMFNAFTQDPGSPPGFGTGWGERGFGTMAMDFGAAIPVNRIRFYPRLGRDEDRLLIEELAEPKPSLEAFGQDSFVDNYLAWYQIQVTDDETVSTPDCVQTPGDPRAREFGGLSDPRFHEIKISRENLDVVVDLQFPTRSMRWIQLRVFPLRNWEIAEFEVFGEGFVEESVLVSQILDFGKTIHLGKVRWLADVPEGTRIEIRTRTGHSENFNRYFAENTNGEIREIPLTEYRRIDVSGRLPTVFDTDNWSFWSPPYDFTAGQRDVARPGHLWEDGTPVLSPVPARYMQLEIRLFSTFGSAPRLEQLTFQLAEELSVQDVVGEIWPNTVDSFEPTTFSYVVRPIFESTDSGFDRLEILTQTRVDSLRSVKVDGVPVDFDVYVPQIMEDRVVVAFPKLVGEEDSFKQIEVTFDTAVLRFGTEFIGFVYNSEADQIRQRVTPGNASFRFSGNGLAVQTPLGGNLLRQVEARPNPFTPNDDGRNEAVTFSFKLREVTAERPVVLRIHDLSGRIVHELPVIQATSGQFEYVWNGRDVSGSLLPPGIYLYEVTLEAENEESRVGTVALIY